MGADLDIEQKKSGKTFPVIGELLFFALLFFVPTLNGSPFGWLIGLVATPVTYLLVARGMGAGGRLLRNSLLLAAVLSLLTGRLNAFLFVLSIIPMGYAFWQGITLRESAAKSGLRGLIALCLGGLFFWFAFAVVTDSNPYNQLRELVDQDIQRNIELITQQQDTPPAELQDIQRHMESFRQQASKILPAVIALIGVSTIWINMVLINAVLSRLGTFPYPWGRYDTWKLPEQLVWLFIAAIIVVFFVEGGVLWQSAFALMLLSGLLYFFQGLAVLLALLNRWRTPLSMRLLLYGAILLFPAGAPLLSILGLIEVWVPLRRNNLASTDTEHN